MFQEVHEASQDALRTNLNARVKTLEKEIAEGEMRLKQHLETMRGHNYWMAANRLELEFIRDQRTRLDSWFAAFAERRDLEIRQALAEVDLGASPPAAAVESGIDLGVGLNLVVPGEGADAVDEADTAIHTSSAKSSRAGERATQ